MSLTTDAHLVAFTLHLLEQRVVFCAHPNVLFLPQKIKKPLLSGLQLSFSTHDGVCHVHWVLYWLALKPGCLTSHSWVHTPDCKEFNEFRLIGGQVTPCWSFATK